MNTDGRSLPRNSWLSRGAPLERSDAASRISAYIYGNILVLARSSRAPHRTALLLAEPTVLVRIGGIVFVIGRLNGERPSRNRLISAAALTVVAATIVGVKVVLTH